MLPQDNQQPARLFAAHSSIPCYSHFRPLHNKKSPQPELRAFGRSGGIRTHGIHIPNVARYQLRYTPISFILFSCKQCVVCQRCLGLPPSAKRHLSSIARARAAHKLVHVLSIICKKRPHVK